MFKRPGGGVMKNRFISKKMPAFLFLAIFLILSIASLVGSVKSASAVDKPFLYASWDSSEKAIELDWGWTSISTTDLTNEGTLSYRVYCNGTEVKVDDANTLKVRSNTANSGKTCIYNVVSGKSYTFTLKGANNDLPAIGPATATAVGVPGGFSATPELVGTTIKVAWQRDDSTQAMTIIYKTPGIGNAVTHTIAAGASSGTDSWVPHTADGGAAGLGDSNCTVTIKYGDGSTSVTIYGDGSTDKDTALLPADTSQATTTTNTSSGTKTSAATGVDSDTIGNGKQIDGLTYPDASVPKTWYGKLIAAGFKDLADVLINWVGATGEGKLVFSSGTVDGQWGWLTDDIKPVMQSFYLGLLAIAMLLIAIPLYKAMFSVMSDLTSAIDRSVAKEEIKNIIIGIFFMILFPVIFSVFNDVNQLIMTGVGDLIHNIISTSTVATTNGIPYMVDTNNGFDFGKYTYGIDFGNIILSAFSWLFYAIMLVWLNFLFLIRKALLFLLYGIAPLMALFYMLGGSAKRTGYGTYLSEVLSNIFMPTCYGISLGASLILMLKWQPGNLITATFVRVFLLFFGLKAGSFLRKLMTGWFNLIGFDEEGMAGQVTGISAAMGLGALRTVTAGAAGFAGGVAGKLAPKPKNSTPGTDLGAASGGGNITTVPISNAASAGSSTSQVPVGANAVASNIGGGAQGNTPGSNIGPNHSSGNTSNTKYDKFKKYGGAALAGIGGGLLGAASAGIEGAGSFASVGVENFGGRSRVISNAMVKHPESINKDTQTTFQSIGRLQAPVIKGGFDHARNFVQNNISRP